MRLKLIIVAVICFVNSAYSQDTLAKNYELGTVLMTHRYSSSVFGIPDAPLNNFFTGIFFRYHINRWGFRTELNYSESNTKTENNFPCLDCFSGTSNNNVFEISGGAQYKLAKKINYLYVFSDLYYKNVNSKGLVSGGLPGLNDSFKLSSGSIGCNYGLGASLIIWKKIRISPEVGYDLCYSNVKNVRTDLVTGEIANEKTSVINATMKAKLLLTVPF
jgi:hypothetical protein